MMGELSKIEDYLNMYAKFTTTNTRLAYLYIPKQDKYL